MELNFFDIRAYGGSKNSGFEELICQLAHLDRPRNGKRFVRKEGAGGDAGVECYWILDDDSEIGWQVKYFPDNLNTSQWQQIDKSFLTALEKHPKLIRYVVCLPLDKSDSRKKGRGKNRVNSFEDKWIEHVEKWKSTARTAGRTIEFSYWGKHEITKYLTIDDPLYSGRALYWFNEPFINTQIFTHIAERSKTSLGERYTPELHVNLSVSKTFDSLCLNNTWWNTLHEKQSELKKAYQKFNSFIEEAMKTNSIQLNNDKTRPFDNRLSDLLEKINNGIKNKDFHINIPIINDIIENILYEYTNSYDTVKNTINFREIKNHPKADFFDLHEEINSFKCFLKSNAVISSQTKSAILYGEAGIGKSHILCDLAIKRVNDKLPTIFLLGAQYQGGSPSNLIKESLDLSNYRVGQVLGAIDAAGEAAGERALIIIDAINEGNYKEEWHDQIIGFLSDLDKYPHIAIIFSCRSTYLNYILPDGATEDLLPRIKHYGFRGYEHRAAEKFLSQQGIAKPSSPILAPEFTNPLFLKTCCKAIKQKGLNSFPKGLNSITSLFAFYIESIERVISKKKRFNHNEKIIQKVLFEIASNLFPTHLDGIPTALARCLINKYDPNPLIGESLYNILLDEGVISEDISNSSEVIVRFTYERFSDYFIAQEIVSKEENITTIFSRENHISKIFHEKGIFPVAGIFEALAIIIPERFKTELNDIIPAMEDHKYQLDEIFKNTILWRSQDSITNRTLEILNNLEDDIYTNHKLDILLQLSTEPNHPWNAELLHRNLINKNISERDHFWSIHIALGDRSEENDEYESTIRSIIEWAHSGEIKSVDDERIRLCAITLLWFLSSPNRRIRDRSTKSLVRILSARPYFIKELLHKFSKVNDTYITERLYAAAYGVVCNSNDHLIMHDIANTTYELIFKDKTPINHVLIRDYARGILEYALYLGILPKEISKDQFSPPYKNDKKLIIPLQTEIDSIPGDNFSSKIKSSIMGFPGDFGNYTMNCVSDWSCTPIEFPKAENALELKIRFANDYLTGDIKEKYLESINKKNEISSMHEICKSIMTNSLYDDDNDDGQIYNIIMAQLKDEHQKNYFSWIAKAANNRAVSFSKDWAQRWVCKRAHEFGWSEQLFNSFESICSYGRSGGYGGAEMERMGKKYQWMAFHEFLSILSDSYHWINRGYSDILDDDVYNGPWQIYKRDIDPTIWARTCGDKNFPYNKNCTWWQPYKFPFPIDNDLRVKQSFLWDRSLLPDFPRLLKLENENSDWIVLHGFWSESKEYLDGNSNSPYLDAWFRINAIFIKKGEFEKLSKSINNKSLCDPQIINSPSTHHLGFFGEYPWHEIYNDYTGWQLAEQSHYDIINIDHLIPFTKYEWENSGGDHSLDTSMYFNMPAKELIKGMNLERPSDQWGTWRKDGEVTFMDPSIHEDGPSYALIKAKELETWLEDNEMEIVWLIGGEKQMFSPGASSFFGRLIYSGLYKYENNTPVGDLWFETEE